MENKEQQTINEIFENRKEFIPEIGEQLKKERKETIEVNGEELEIDYRIISNKELSREEYDPVVLLPGFGSGWEGISELGFSLSCEGRKVMMPSLPGYGTSENPSASYYESDNYDNEVEALNQLLYKINPRGRKVHLIGHSMGSEIMAAFSRKYPQKVSSLVLLNPAGVEEEENLATLAPKFLLSGAQTSAEFKLRQMFSGEEDYEEGLKKYIPDTKSPFAKDRLKQRAAEAKKLTKGHLLDNLKNSGDVPITYISGELDTVYPPGKEDDKSSQLARVIKAAESETRIEKSVMKSLRHNTTIAPDEITAANIAHYLEKNDEGVNEKE